MTLQECFDRRQLRTVSPDNLKAASSIETAVDKLAQAQELEKAIRMQWKRVRKIWEM